MESYIEAWKLILKLNEFIRNHSSINLVAISKNGNDFDISEELSSTTAIEIHLSKDKDVVANQSETVIICDKPFHFEVIKNVTFDQKWVSFLSMYLPHAVLPYFSEKMDKVFVTSHFAQTLDGKIASNTGDSKWIGNEENLIHAHRMRALSDAIGVGSGTLKIDQPLLNVRHVEGADPIKVIIGNVPQSTELAKDMLIVNQKSLGLDGNQHCEPKQILNFLKKKNIRTLYLEGGAITTSRFIKDRCIDQIQVHISPRILGQGKTGFQFEGINTMDESIRLNNHTFHPMGDQVMLVGEL